MKWLFSLGLAILIFLSQPAISTAVLVPLPSDEPEVIWDQTYNLYWYYNVSDFVNMTWNEQKNAVLGLAGSSYYGSSGWHIATLGEMEKLWTYSSTDLVDAFPLIFGGYESYYTFAGRYDSVEGVLVHALTLSEYNGESSKESLPGTQSADWGTDWYLGVWVTTASPVPIPGAIWLLGSGLIGIVGIRRKFKN